MCVSKTSLAMRREVVGSKMARSFSRQQTLRLMLILLKKRTLAPPVHRLISMRDGKKTRKTIEIQVNDKRAIPIIHFYLVSANGVSENH